MGGELPLHSNSTASHSPLSFLLRCKAVSVLGDDRQPYTSLHTLLVTNSREYEREGTGKADRYERHKLHDPTSVKNGNYASSRVSLHSRYSYQHFYYGRNLRYVVMMLWRRNSSSLKCPCLLKGVYEQPAKGEGE